MCLHLNGEGFTRGMTVELRPGINGAEADTGPEAFRLREALFIYRSLRSGQSVRHDGPVVVVGDVNPGAELIAAGDIIVVGVVRGVAHAGCRGDVSARVVACPLEPTQLRIAGIFGRAPDGEWPGRVWSDTVRDGDGAGPGPVPGPEMARVEGGRIVIRGVRCPSPAGPPGIAGGGTSKEGVHQGGTDNRHYLGQGWGRQDDDDG